MADSIVGSVIEYLAYDDDSLRDIALNWLCEGYLDEPTIARAVFDQWDTRNPEIAFSQFPMLSYFPIPSELIDETCQRAAEMVAQGRELTSLTTRCAGKLMEQLVRLPVKQLEGHIQNITQVTQSHKIFFRVDRDSLQSRLSLAQKTSDELCELLDRSIEALTQNAEDRRALLSGQHALEALRTNYPGILDLTAVFNEAESKSQRAKYSLQLTLLSLAQFADDSAYESHLSWLLHSPDLSLLSSALESLVRYGSGSAAQVLLEQFQTASETNRRWIARGLQRMRIHNLAPLIAQLRDRVSDNTTWIMLLVAEMQQLDPKSGQRIMQAWNELEAVNPTVVDAGLLYTFVCSPFHEKGQSSELEMCYRDFLLRVQSGLGSVSSQSAEQADTRANGQGRMEQRRQRSKQLEQLFKKRNRQ